MAKNLIFTVHTLFFSLSSFVSLVALSPSGTVFKTELSSSDHDFSKNFPLKKMLRLNPVDMELSQKKNISEEKNSLSVTFSSFRKKALFLIKKAFNAGFFLSADHHCFLNKCNNQWKKLLGRSSETSGSYEKLSFFSHKNTETTSITQSLFDLNSCLYKMSLPVSTDSSQSNTKERLKYIISYISGLNHQEKISNLFFPLKIFHAILSVLSSLLIPFDVIFYCIFKIIFFFISLIMYLFYFIFTSLYCIMTKTQRKNHKKNLINCFQFCERVLMSMRVIVYFLWLCLCSGIYILLTVIYSFFIFIGALFLDFLVFFSKHLKRKQDYQIKELNNNNKNILEYSIIKQQTSSLESFFLSYLPKGNNEEKNLLKLFVGTLKSTDGQINEFIQKNNLSLSDNINILVTFFKEKQYIKKFFHNDIVTEIDALLEKNVLKGRFPPIYIRRLQIIRNIFAAAYNRTLTTKYLNDSIVPSDFLPHVWIENLDKCS